MEKRSPRAALGLIALAAASLAACGLYIAPDRYYVVEADEALELAARRAVIVLDARPPADFAAGHARGALSIPLSQLWRRLDELPPEQGTYFILYDDDSERALRAGSLLRREGYFRVHVVRGGFSAWARAGGPVEKGEPAEQRWYQGSEIW